MEGEVYSQSEPRQHSVKLFAAQPHQVVVKMAMCSSSGMRSLAVARRRLLGGRTKVPLLVLQHKPPHFLCTRQDFLDPQREVHIERPNVARHEWQRNKVVVRTHQRNRVFRVCVIRRSRDVRRSAEGRLRSVDVKKDVGCAAHRGLFQSHDHPRQRIAKRTAIPRALTRRALYYYFFRAIGWCRYWLWWKCENDRWVSTDIYFWVSISTTKVERKTVYR